jgi:putative transposase
MQLNQNIFLSATTAPGRQQLLGRRLFDSLDDAREATYWWMIRYNEERPHDSLGDLTPLEARAKT